MIESEVDHFSILDSGIIFILNNINIIISINILKVFINFSFLPRIFRSLILKIINFFTVTFDLRNVSKPIFIPWWNIHRWSSEVRTHNLMKLNNFIFLFILINLWFRWQEILLCHRNFWSWCFGYGWKFKWLWWLW